VLRHALRHALVASAPVFGLNCALVINACVLVEPYAGVPGALGDCDPDPYTGRMVCTTIGAGAIEGDGLLAAAALIAVSSALFDVLQAALNPRIRLGAEAT